MGDNKVSDKGRCEAVKSEGCEEKVRRGDEVKNG